MVLRGEGMAMLIGESKILAFVKGNDEDARFRRLHNGLLH
jgi:hypothetical protein